MGIVRVMFLGVFMAFASGALAAPTKAAHSDTLTVTEKHELELVQFKQARLEEAIAHFRAEAAEIDQRIRKAHGMTADDAFDVAAGKVARGANKPHGEPPAKPHEKPAK